MPFDIESASILYIFYIKLQSHTANCGTSSNAAPPGLFAWHICTRAEFDSQIRRYVIKALISAQNVKGREATRV